MKAKMRLNTNVEYMVRDANGRIKRLFQPWGWVQSLIKGGLLSPEHPKIPVILGRWTPQLRISNLITNDGLARVAVMLGATTGTPFTYIAVGTGTNAAAATDTALQTEISDSGLARASATNSIVTTDTANDTRQLLKSFSVTGTKAVTESGVFSEAATGTMLARQVFSAINVVNGDTLQITWKIDVD